VQSLLLNWYLSQGSDQGATNWQGLDQDTENDMDNEESEYGRNNNFDYGLDDFAPPGECSHCCSIGICHKRAIKELQTGKVLIKIPQTIWTMKKVNTAAIITLTPIWKILHLQVSAVVIA
jgi:hypothetical protein